MPYSFHATDADITEENSKLFYRIIAGNDYDIFRLDTDSGEMQMVRWNDTFATEMMIQNAKNANLSDESMLVRAKFEFGQPVPIKNGKYLCSNLFF